MTVTCFLMGGLGNQLFQIFTTIAYAMRHKHVIQLLNIESLGDGVATTKRQTYWPNLLRQLRPFLVTSFSGERIRHREPQFAYTPLPKYPASASTFVELFGYFQSHRYFADAAAAIVRMLKFDQQRTELLQRLDAALVANLPATIALHFRLGDYKKLEQYHPIMTMRYYIAALRRMPDIAANVPATVLYFYQESPEDDATVADMVAALQDAFPSVRFQKAPLLEDYEQLLLMSACGGGYVIANSSFSWWGAYLGQVAAIAAGLRAPIVCYPATWFGPGNPTANTADMCPPNWRRVEV